MVLTEVYTSLAPYQLDLCNMYIIEPDIDDLFKGTNTYTREANNNIKSLGNFKKMMEQDYNPISRYDVLMSHISQQENPEIGINTTLKQDAEQKSKKKVRKFKIGEHYLIYPMNNKKLRREFVVKKTIYSIKDREVNIVIMKQVSGSESTKFTLNKEDCLKFHLKFEDGLQVFSMELDWKLLKNKK